MEALPPKIQNRIEKIDDSQWSLIIASLIIHASYKFRLNSWKCQLPKGNEAKDIAFEAINDLLTGERNWNTEKYPEIIDFLKGVVDSKIYNLARSGDHKSRTMADNDEIVSKAKSKPDSEYEIEVEKEEEFRDRLFECVSGDDVLEETLLYLVEDYKPRDIAQELDIPVDEVYNRIRRLRRHLNKKLSI